MLISYLGHFLDVKKLHTYLGIGFDNTMSWSSHVQKTSNRSTKVLNFIKQNLYNCSPNTKRIAYLTLVRPIMEYATSVWDSYYNTEIYLIVVTWARVICLICMPKARGSQARGLRAYISGKSRVPMLQQLCNTFLVSCVLAKSSVELQQLYL